jgi:diguanylate cyclase
MIKVLLVEDNPADARLVREILNQENSPQYHLSHVERASAAVERLGSERFDAVLLDLGLPDVVGLEAAERVLDAAPDMPIVVMSGQSDETLAVEAVKQGAQDYLMKGQGDGALLSRAIRYAIERKRSEKYIHHLAHHDNLTSLPNRRLLLDRVDQGLARSHRSRAMMGVIFLDLDNFKTINDTLGHEAGDLLLKEVADRLKSCVRESDTVARWGGDEFSLILPEVASPSALSHVATKILEKFRSPFRVGGLDLFVTVSIGISIYPSDSHEPEDLIRNADLAMYRAKTIGKNRFEFYSPWMNVKASERLAMSTALRNALERGELSLVYQPIVNLETGLVTGLEALLRWDHAVWGQKPVIDFVRLAEDTGLIIPIGDRVLDMACSQYARWKKDGIAPERLAVNFSCRQIGQLDLPRHLGKCLDRAGLIPNEFELELTESSLMSNTDTSRTVTDNLAEMGVRVSVDDFGTGYSSLSRLSEFKIDRLKIDQSFIRDLTAGGPAHAITGAIVAMGHALNLKVTAEGVERPDQLQILKQQGCDDLQGFLFCKPMSGEAVTEVLKAPGGWDSLRTNGDGFDNMNGSSGRSGTNGGSHD